MALVGHTPFYVGPRQNVNTLFCVQEGRLVPVWSLPPNTLPGEYDPTYDDIWDISPSGWIAWYDVEAERINRGHVDAEPERHRFAPLPLPKSFTVRSFAFVGDLLFVGGEASRHLSSLGYFDLADRCLEWRPVPGFEGTKTPLVTADAQHGDRAIVLSESDRTHQVCFVPTDTAVPIAVHNHECRAVHEDGVSVAIGSHFLAILRLEWGFAAESFVTSVFDLAGLREWGVVWVQTQPGIFDYGVGPADFERARPWHHLAFRDDLLLIAADTNGLGLLNLSEAHIPARLLTAGAAGVQDFSRWCQSALQYVRPPEVPVGGIRRVRPVPGSTDLLVVSEDAGTYDSVLVGGSAYMSDSSSPKKTPEA